MHETVDVGKSREGLDLVVRLDETTGNVFKSLDRVNTVTDVRTADLKHLNGQPEDISTELGTGRHRNSDHGGTGTGKASSLLVRLGGGGQDQGTVGTTVGGSLDSLNHVGFLLEVKEDLSTEGLDELSLVITSINGNNTHSHSLGVLDGKMAKTTTGTGNADPLTRADLGFLQGTVASDTSAHDGSSNLEGNRLGDDGSMGGIGNAVVLESTVNGVTGKLNVRADGLLSLHTVLAVTARRVHPLDTNTVTNLKTSDTGTDLDDDTSTFVTTDQRHLGGKRPVTLKSVQIGVADTGVLDVNQDLVLTGLGDGDFLELDVLGTTVGVENGSQLLVRNSHYVVRKKKRLKSL